MKGTAGEQVFAGLEEQARQAMMKNNFPGVLGDQRPAIHPLQDPDSSSSGSDDEETTQDEVSSHTSEEDGSMVKVKKELENAERPVAGTPLMRENEEPQNADATLGLSQCPLCQLECGSRDQLIAHVYQHIKVCNRRNEAELNWPLTCTSCLHPGTSSPASSHALSGTSCSSDAFLKMKVKSYDPTHGSSGECQELPVSCVWQSPQLTGVPWEAPLDPLRGPAVQLCSVWNTLHQPLHLQQREAAGGAQRGSAAGTAEPGPLRCRGEGRCLSHPRGVSRGHPPGVQQLRRVPQAAGGAEPRRAQVGPAAAERAPGGAAAAPGAGAHGQEEPAGQRDARGARSAAHAGPGGQAAAAHAGDGRAAGAAAAEGPRGHAPETRQRDPREAAGPAHPGARGQEAQAALGENGHDAPGSVWPGPLCHGCFGS
ncbi:zinc finger protein 821 isoform X2 [Pithys albifrons albifrons]|uniref:zinc finger protein 821 isoform X2 n=1 Tax=Pithys albifrons albifrons TaxID=3385563 RepID=UPI003A5CE7D5